MVIDLRICNVLSFAFLGIAKRLALVSTMTLREMGIPGVQIFLIKFASVNNMITLAITQLTFSIISYAMSLMSEFITVEPPPPPLP
jgi:hypothetical protein